MKRIITSALLLLVLCVPAFTQNAGDFTVDANGVITKYLGFDAVIVIPAVIGGKKITAIGDEAFLRSELTKVTISEGIMEIRKSAFDGNKLTSITIPNSVTKIGNSAFANNRLTSVTIPGSVNVIGSSAFENNTALAKIVISEGVEAIWDRAFAKTNCTSVSLPSTITYIHSTSMYAAFDLSGKPSFTLAANINATFDFIPAFYSYIANDRKAGTYAFILPLVSKKADDYEYYETRYGAVLTKYTGNSTRVRIPATIGGIAVKALYGSNNYGGYFIGTFQEKKLAAVQIPEGITYIGENTFAKNELTNVTIPNSVTYLRGLNNNELLTSVTIGNSVISIGKEAFYECKNITSVTIPNSVTSIGDSAFYKCNNLTSITLGNSVTSIGEKAFSDCTSLTSITIPESVTSIGKEAFYSFSGSLTSVTFQGTITSDNFHDNAFGYDDLLKKYLAGGIGTYTRRTNHDQEWRKTQSISQPAASQQTTTQTTSAASSQTTAQQPAVGTPGLNYKFFEANNIKYYGVGKGSVKTGDVVIPASYNNLPVLVIWDNAFEISGITGITIPNSVKAIGETAFLRCTKLTSITIPDSVTSIGGWAFLLCTKLTSVTISNSVTSIGVGVFYGCTTLTDVTIPDSVTSIGKEAFRKCTGLTGITIPSNVLEINQDAFRDCSSLISVTFQGNIDSGKFHNQAFNGLGDLRAKYLAGGIGTYTRPNGKSNTWTKQ